MTCNTLTIADLKAAGSGWTLLAKVNGADTSVETRFIVLRHGESVGQIKPELYRTLGDANLSLTDWGVGQSYEAGVRLARYAQENNLDRLHVISGACLRTDDTTAGIVEGIGNAASVIRVRDERLGKQKFGRFDGLLGSAERAAALPAEHLAYEQERKVVGDFNVRPPGGESIADVFARAGSLIVDVRQAGIKNAVFVTHGLLSLCVEAHLLGHDKQWVLDHADQTPNCNIRLLEPLAARDLTANVTYQARTLGHGLRRPPGTSQSLPYPSVSRT